MEKVLLHLNYITDLLKTLKTYLNMLHIEVGRLV